MTEDELAALERKADDQGSIDYAETLRVVAYARTLRTRNENLSRQYRIAENTAEQIAVPLGHVRQLSERHGRGEIDAHVLAGGVDYWVTQ